MVIQEKERGTSKSPILVSPPDSNGSSITNDGTDSTDSNHSTPGKRLKRKSAQMASLKNQLIYANPLANNPTKLLENELQVSPIIVESSGNDSTPPPTINSPSKMDVQYVKDIRSLLDKNRLNGNGIHKIDKIEKPKGKFIEPELSGPKPSYTGLPLESFPNAKIKKDSLWTKLKKVKTGDKETVLIEIPDEVENKYKIKLNTNESNNLTNDSKIRSINKPVKNPKIKQQKENQKQKLKKKSSSPSSANSTTSSKSKTKLNKIKKEDISQTPKISNGGKSKDLTLSTTPGRSSKRIKVISPQKSITSNNLFQSLNHNDSETNQLDESTNDDFCSSCGGSGVFICCETCPKSFHFICCDPPLDDLPEDNWSCRECIAQKDLTLTKKWNNIGVFGQLLNQTETMNPFEFQLPKKVRDNTFIKVSTNSHGEYNDGTMKPELSYSKLNGSQIPGFNYNHNLEIDSIYDKSGKPYLCHNCGLSGLENKVLVHCDYCSLVWHLDCLKEPCYKPKTIGSKWRCPNHIENLVPIDLFSKRTLKDTSIIDVSLRSHFLEIIQKSNYLIKYKDQPFLKNINELDGKNFPTLQEYLQYEMEDFKRYNPKYSKDIFDPKGINTLDNNDDIHDNYKVPDFFNNNYAIDNTVVAKPTNELKKIMIMTDEVSDDPFNEKDETNFDSNKVSSFIYRIPEELILLDFITKVKKPENKSKRAQQRRNKDAKNHILKNIEYYERESEKEIEMEDEFIDNVEHFKNKEIVKKPNNSELDRLIEVALKDSQNQSINNNSNNSNSNSNSNNSNNSGNNNLNNEEDDISTIKRLMQIKGKQALLDFLKS